MEWKAERIGAEEGLQVWRVEKLELKEVDETEFGNFFSGDCYVLLKRLSSYDPWIAGSSELERAFLDRRIEFR
ncbi:hypothetical protein L596_014770 [Steinernema carpocapsae]|uniref:Uncharacterized protein n=1 Tax=Steinernema carpocapsae TaxID=34508 RepID=A0A4U5NDQ2_STECR|nr:hypothetical protein L596_014770 [Steinernema carpocapsae]